VVDRVVRDFVLYFLRGRLVLEGLERFGVFLEGKSRRGDYGRFVTELYLF
jgi:hypothetical protein